MWAANGRHVAVERSQLVLGARLIAMHPDRPDLVRHRPFLVGRPHRGGEPHSVPFAIWTASTSSTYGMMAMTRPQNCRKGAPGWTNSCVGTRHAGTATTATRAARQRRCSTRSGAAH
jgi:hypothetical protein